MTADRDLGAAAAPRTMTAKMLVERLRSRVEALGGMAVAGGDLTDVLRALPAIEREAAEFEAAESGASPSAEYDLATLDDREPGGRSAMSLEEQVIREWLAGQLNPETDGPLPPSKRLSEPLPRRRVPTVVASLIEIIDGLRGA